MTLKPRLMTLSVVALASLILTACQGETERRPSPQASISRSSPTDTGTPSTKDESSSPPSFLVWAPGGLSDEALRAVRRTKGVQRAPIITGGTLWMDKASAGKQPPPGYSVPLEVAFVQPKAFSAVVPLGETIPVLGEVEAVIAETAYNIRGRPEVPFSLHTQPGPLRVVGVVADDTTAGFEVIAAGSAPRRWGASYTIATGEVTARDLRRAVRDHVDGPFRVKPASDVPFLRHADAVHPPMLLKERFGEFAARPLPDGRLDMHPAWVERNIVEEKVPILGRITCHATFLEQVKGALETAARKGLGDLIDPGGYAGCYSPRFILSDPSGRLSSHAWGAAFDINAPENGYGAEPQMDPRLVQHMENWGFYWGGRWMIPDGMHFEWGRVLD